MRLPGWKMPVLLVVLMMLPWYGMARPDGAPLSACRSLTPSHSGIGVQGSNPPYDVTATKIGDKIRVTISSPVGEEFEGFVLQARSSRDKRKLVEGKFTARNGVSKTIDCLKGKENTLTQVNTNPKSKIVTEWMPANGVNEDVIFRATVAKTYALFWTEIDSSSTRVKAESNYQQGVSKERKQSQKMDSSTMYQDCFSSQGCFGYPSDCIPSEDCQVLLGYSLSNGGILFRLKGVLNSPDSYVAMALSWDQRMGDDAVMECVEEGNYAILRQSWNEGKRNNRTREVPRDIYTSEISDGQITCEWNSDPIIRTHKGTFNLDNTTYYLLLAKGPMSNGKISYHSGKIFTQSPVNFSAFEGLEGGKAHDAVKIHGTFMVTAWVGFVSVAILLARHFKSAWETKTMCGVKIWFALHRGLMIAALTFVVIAFIVIFVHLDGWNYENKNPHAILGCIATAFGLFQPIMAAFRPAPDNPKRPIFNWLHWIVGNSAQLIAVVAIFFARSLQASGLKESFYWVMAIFVIVYLIFHFLFQLHSWTSDKKKNNEIKMNEMTHVRGATNNIQGNSQEKNSSANMFRVLLLGVFVIFVAVILLALYALIGVA
ncbi:putative ferric-chelate reductase 1 homolog isoform X2 [Uloborus diversus]|uniref:putative ferric-chelate reductase 1 homolog isoform X2 n=1 Tax=Uloborus diversus TaxID=327109 RepID=UPI00240A4629|nr:putative ferric-chelate reductase 1 homolog isoform X2 [Uloborus diversus]